MKYYCLCFSVTMTKEIVNVHSVFLSTAKQTCMEEYGRNNLWRCDELYWCQMVSLLWKGGWSSVYSNKCSYKWSMNRNRLKMYGYMRTGTRIPMWELLDGLFQDYVTDPAWTPGLEKDSNACTTSHHRPGGLLVYSHRSVSMHKIKIIPSKITITNNESWVWTIFCKYWINDQNGCFLHPQGWRKIIKFGATWWSLSVFFGQVATVNP